MYHVTRHGQWETGGHLSTHFLLLDKASPASHSLVPNRELCNLRYTNTHTRVHRGALAGEKVVYRSGKTQNHIWVLLWVSMWDCTLPVSHLNAVFAQPPRTHSWKRKLGTDLPPFSRKQALSMFSYLGRTHKGRGDLPLTRMVMCIQKSPAAQDST